MRTGWTIFILVLALSGARAELTVAADKAVNEDLQWVVVLSDPRPPRRRGWVAGAGYRSQSAYDRDPALSRLTDAIADEHKLEVVDQWPVMSLAVHCLVIKLDKEETTVLDALRSDSRVEWVQPLNEFEARSSPRHKTGTDPYRPLQSALDSLNVESVTQRYDGSGIQIAVIDSGVEPDHPDIRHALADNRNFVGGNDGHHAESHGTGIAGVLIAKAHNREGISGVAPGARLLAYRACWEGESGMTRCNSLTLSRALDRVVAARPHIVNLSLTGPRDRLLERLMDRIIETGAIVVTAHDERRAPADRFPAPRSGLLVVHNGSGLNGAPAGVITAPGNEVLTAQPGHRYDFMSGHSLAAAHVSGVLALVLEARPGTSGERAQAVFAESTRGRSGTYSIDACLAVSIALENSRCALAERVTQFQ